MKKDVLMYEKVYRILKNKIESGLLPSGVKLPSRANLCKEFNTSEKTVRHALQQLAQEGYIEVSQRKRPTVAKYDTAARKASMHSLQKIDVTAANDVLQTGILLCYPLNARGMTLCQGEDWQIPETIVQNMDPEEVTTFWRLSNRLWRFFIARNGNELILRAVDSLGFTEVDLLPGTLEIRQRYKAGLCELIETLKRGGEPEKVHFDDLFQLYGFLSKSSASPYYYVRPDSPLRVGAVGLEHQLFETQERYSSVFLNLLGMIALGRYQLGDKLPTHRELMEQYNVSVNTTVKAVQTLQEWGVVTTKRGQGIFVSMGIEDLKKLSFDSVKLASHIRRFLDSLELLSLTVEGVTVHAAERVTREEARGLLASIDELWNGRYLYQQSPIVMLEFITRHIRYDALRAIYSVIHKNYHLGRGIPRLVNRDKNSVSLTVYQQCMETAELLAAGNVTGFAENAARMFQRTHQMVISACKRLGYWEDAMRAYDGTALWK